MSRKNSNPNYLTFGTTEVVVVPKEDRGKLRQNDYGPFFYREFTDGRFACCSEDLERRLIDAGVRAGVLVGIRKERYNGNSVIWHVRLLNAPATEMPRTARKVNGHAGDQAWDNLPAEKYAPPSKPTLEEQLHASIEHVEAKKSAPPSTPAITGLARCFIEAIDSLIVAKDYAQSKGIDLRLHLELTGADLQDLAATLYIAQAKAANVALMNRNESLRRENGR
jgi:hypothetical protein